MNHRLIPHRMDLSEKRADSLVEEIQKTYKKSTFPSGRDARISPSGGLNSVITQLCVEEVLTSPGPMSGPPQKELVDFILRKATKLFAILLVIDLGGERLRTTITSISRDGICDQDLPIDRETLKSTSFKILRRVEWENFSNYQWFFLAPVFSPINGIKRIEFHEKTLFPFELCGQMPPRGGFGMVWKAKVHPPHLENQQVRIVAFMSTFYWRFDVQFTWNY